MMSSCDPSFLPELGEHLQEVVNYCELETQ